MENGRTFRALTLCDVPALMELQAACYPPEVRDDEAAVSALALARSLGAFDAADRLLGAALCCELSHDTIELYSVEVIPEARHAGLASKLVRLFLVQAWTAGAVLCTARAYSVGGHIVLRGAGFVETGATSQLNGIDGSVMHLRVLELARPHDACTSGPRTLSSEA